MIIRYKSGNYPTTMQMYYDKFDENLYKGLHEEYIEKFKLSKLFNKFKYKYNENHKFYVNMSAYLILDPQTNNVVAFAFSELHDLLWICQVLNIDNLEFKLPKKVGIGIQKDLEIYSDRIEIIK
ncbi:MAG: hypothetical protein K2K73_00660 [Ureaplasma sp.]|nr:hypothetical protein [Ureaplasma sp.]